MQSIDNPELLEILNQYQVTFPAETEALTGLSRQLIADEVLNDRKNFNGHVTGGAFVLSPDKTKLLVIHHNLFQRWLQPGGHWDPGEVGPWAAAKREAIEETSVTIAAQIPTFENDVRIPFDITPHDIMARPDKNEPSHIHYDFRYVFQAAHEAINHRESEVSQAVWMPFDDTRLKNLATLLRKLRDLDIIS